MGKNRMPKIYNISRLCSVHREEKWCHLAKTVCYFWSAFSLIPRSPREVSRSIPSLRTTVPSFHKTNFTSSVHPRKTYKSEILYLLQARNHLPWGLLWRKFLLWVLAPIPPASHMSDVLPPLGQCVGAGILEDTWGGWREVMKLVFSWLD